jgi:hypothetical protein
MPENLTKRKLKESHMKLSKNLSLPASILICSIFPTTLFSQVNSAHDNKLFTTSNDVTAKYGALAIDRGNGFYFGWAADCSTLAEAEKKSIENCSKKGGRCTVVLSWSGTGCAVYRFITGNVGMGYGWGLAKTKEEADTKAKKECAERSYGLPAPNMVWNCNSSNSGELKEIYNAHDELKGLQPGAVVDY